MPRIADRVAWVLSDAGNAAPATCLVSKVPDQQPFLLKGSAVLLWLAWADRLSLQETIDEVAELFGLSSEAVASDVHRLHDRLVRDGVLVPDKTQDGVPRA